MNTATKVKKLDNMRGDAAVYRLEPPMDGLEFVVASAVDLDFGGTSMDMSWYRNCETMIFPSDGEDVTSWGELTMVPEKSHSLALAEIGYEVSDD